MADIACSYCGRKGILIYPVRYAVACPNGEQKVPGISGNFKIVGGPNDISPAKYVLRTLRTGYLYTYEEKKRRLKAYVVLPNGALWEFPVEYIPTVDPNRVNSCCLDGVSVSLSYCIDIAVMPNESVGNIWIGWSNVLWTKASVAKVSDANWRIKHMQCIDAEAMVRGSAMHTAKFTQYSLKVPHFACGEQALKKAFGFSNASAERETHLYALRATIEKVLQQKCPHGGFVAAVNDPVGICSDLSELTLPADSAGFDEKSYWGKVSGNLLESLENIINANAKEKKERLAKDEKNNPVLGAYGRWGRSMSTRSQNTKSRTSSEAPSADAWTEFTFPEGKPLINKDERKKFSTRYDAAMLEFQPIAAQFDIHHTAWLKSVQLSNWMQGIHDASDIRSGVCYRESMAQCIGKSAGDKRCAELLKRWLAEGTPSDERNIYARALLFNQKDIIAATEPHLKNSDVPLEGIFNFYKRAVEVVSNNGSLNSFDRLALVTANILISGFSKSASIIAKNLALIGLSLAGEVIIKPSSASIYDVQKWILDESQKSGVQFKENHAKTWAAHGVAKQAIEEYRSSAASVALELDLDQLHRQGIITQETVRVVKIPGVEQAKRWVSSGAPMEFKLGVVTMILQLVALSFATRDLVESDSHNRFEAQWKVGFGSLTLLSTITETAMATMAVRSTHPLSVYLNGHWGLTQTHVSSYGLLARTAGFFAGVAIAALDIYKGIVFLGEKNYSKGGFYMTLGITSIVLSGLAWIGVIALWWLLAAAVVFSIISVFLNEAALQQWIGKSYFGNSDGKYPDLESELSAYKSALGA